MTDPILQHIVNSTGLIDYWTFNVLSDYLPDQSTDGKFCYRVQLKDSTGNIEDVIVYLDISPEELQGRANGESKEVNDAVQYYKERPEEE